MGERDHGSDFVHVATCARATISYRDSRQERISGASLRLTISLP
jgi:hypothetical protein